MKLNVKKLTIFAIVIIGIITIITPLDQKPIIDKNQIKTTSLIDYPVKFNYRQTINDCGPFSTAAVVRALKKKEVDSKVFAEKIEWRLPNKYTLPWGIEKQLEENGIVVEKPNLESLSDENKILFLQQQLSLSKPIIILGGSNNYEHYITIFGFDSQKDEFYVYDSIHDKKSKSDDDVTKDDNAELPGNRTFSSEELLSFWRNGGMYGIYKWYAIVLS